MLYGLNAVTLPKAEIQVLEKFYKNLLRRLQGLPSSTANTAVYLLAGAIPLEGLLHKRCLSLFGQITRLPADHPLKLLATRQLAMRDEKSSSWFVYVNIIANKYDLNIHQILEHPMKKSQWKSYCDGAIDQYWQHNIICSSAEMSSMKYLIFNFPFQMHGIWASCRGNAHLVNKATTRAKMICRRYSCGDSPWRKIPCLLCNHGIDDMHHILSECHRIENEKIAAKKRELRLLYIEESLTTPESKTEMTSAILNGDCFVSDERTEVIKLKKNSRKGHTLASVLCHEIHTRRDILSNEILIQNEKDNDAPNDTIIYSDLDATIPYNYSDLDATIPYSLE